MLSRSILRNLGILVIFQGILSSCGEIKYTANEINPKFAKALIVMRQNCISCHSEGGDAQFSNFDFQEEVEFLESPWFKAGDPSSAALLRTKGSGNEQATMPLGVKEFNHENFKILKDWLMTTQTPHKREDSVSGFVCQEKDKVQPSELSRVAKQELKNLLEEVFMHNNFRSHKRAVSNSIKFILDSMPDDQSDFYEHNDRRVDFLHVDKLMDLGLQFGKTVIKSDGGKARDLLIDAAGCGRQKQIQYLRDNRECRYKFVSHFGQMAFRRPLTAEEKDRFAETIINSPGIELSAFFARLLSSPEVFYKFYSDGEEAVVGGESVHRLTRYELASRMTSMLWRSPPDWELHRHLNSLKDWTGSTEEVLKLADRIFEDKRSAFGIQSFVSQWLHLEHVPGLKSNFSPAYLEFSAGENIAGGNHRSEMIEEVKRMFLYYIRQDGARFSDLMESEYSFATGDSLARIYGVTPWTENPDEMVRFVDSRRGLLSRAVFLASSSERTRPILKGLSIRQNLLCDKLPDPPATIEITPIVAAPDESTRSAIARVTSQSMCLGCHSKFNPLGFASEAFDSLGRPRAEEARYDDDGMVFNHIPVSTKVSPNIFPGDTSTVADINELGSYIASTGKAQACMIKNYYEYSFGEEASPIADGCELLELQEALMGSQGSLKGFFRKIILLKNFRYRKAE